MRRPVGILLIIAVTALHGTMAAEPHGIWNALLAVAVGVHMAFRRRAILSVGMGTAVYVVLLNPL
ncbi:hypothetical protein [Streptomyces sp. NPDC006510]|uniref:hypothetical protein n=1 Tax=Streptomyces sp. NPDC006510 TaxID=3155600 RepID=UPI0033AEA71A